MADRIYAMYIFIIIIIIIIILYNVLEMGVDKSASLVAPTD